MWSGFSTCKPIGCPLPYVFCRPPYLQGPAQAICSGRSGSLSTRGTADSPSSAAISVLSYSLSLSSTTGGLASEGAPLTALRSARALVIAQQAIEAALQAHMETCPPFSFRQGKCRSYRPCAGAAKVCLKHHHRHLQSRCLCNLCKLHSILKWIQRHQRQLHQSRFLVPTSIVCHASPVSLGLCAYQSPL